MRLGATSRVLSPALVVSLPALSIGVAALVLGCGGAAEKPNDPALSITAAPTASVTAAPKVDPDAVWRKEPIPTAVKDAVGCTISGGQGMIALSVDGESSGVFLDGMWGGHGDVVIVPGGKSSARVTFGSAVFDTGVSLARSRFHLKDRPSPLGGVVHPRFDVPFRVTGGDKDKLAVAMTGYGTDELEWTTPPDLVVPCSGIGGKVWPTEPVPTTKGTLYPTGTDEVQLRADARGPVIVRIPANRTEEVERSGDMVKVLAWLKVGLAIGWTEAKSWSATPPPSAPAISPPKSGGGSGRGWMSSPKAECPPGTPLYLRRGDNLYEIGHLRGPGEAAPNGDLDWRDRKTYFQIETDNLGPKEPIPWIQIRDDFRVTNSYWHDGIDGALAVRRGPSGCTVPDKAKR